MARPKKSRRICNIPEFQSFLSEDGAEDEKVFLNLDEYEAMRLIDYENHTHEMCALQMDISRTTVTEIYESARKKIADAIVNGKNLVISGGNFRLCGGDANGCSSKSFCNADEQNISNINKKEKNIMKIAVTYENEEVFQHFGKTPAFKLYDIENNGVAGSQVVNTNGSGHGALAGFLTSVGADFLICGGIGGGAVMALEEAGIKLFAGVSGNADEAVNALLNGTLVFDRDASCNHNHAEGHHCGHHSEHHHAEGHHCGHHNEHHGQHEGCCGQHNHE